MPLTDYIDGLYVDDFYFEGQFVADVPGDEEQPPGVSVLWRAATASTPQVWTPASTTPNR